MIGCTASEPAAGTRASDRSFAGLRAVAERSLAPASSTPRLDAELLLGFSAGVVRATVIAFPERELAEQDAAVFHRAVQRRARGEPLAYITGDREFYSLQLRVTADVLIPRPETELLVDEVLAHMNSSFDGTVLDLGTGSAAIALAIKHNRPSAQITATDSSSAALMLAAANAAQLDLPLQCVESNWFEALEAKRFDYIVCNPPYLASSDPHFDGPLSFEPRGALDGGDDGCTAFREVLAGARLHLNIGGLLLLEHGYDQREAVLRLADEYGYRVLRVRDDLAGQPRCVALSASIPPARRSDRY